MPVGIETFGAYGPQAIKLIKQIGKKKYRKLPGKICPLFISCKESQWQYKKEMRSVLGKKTSSGLEGLFNFHVQEAEMQ